MTFGGDFGLRERPATVLLSVRERRIIHSRTAAHRMHVIFAQSLGEYVSLGSLGSRIQELSYSISTWLGSLSATTWIIALIVVVGLVVLTRR